MGLQTAVMNFLLVHGSWHNGHCWDQVSKTLSNQSYRCYAPTLLGHGDKAADHNLQFQDYIDHLVDYVLERGLYDLVLVGHSMGGTLVCKLAEAIPERIRRLIFISAIIVRDKHSFVDEVPPDYAVVFTKIAKESPNNCVMVPWSVWRDSFIGDADETLAKSIYGKLNPEPFAPMQEKISMRGFHQLDIPRSYIHCLDDVAFPPGEWGWFPRMYNRITPARLIQMPGSHEVMYTRPRQLAENLVIAGRD